MRMLILNWLKTKPTLMLLLERSVINNSSVRCVHRLVMTGRVRVTARASHACAWSMAVWSFSFLMFSFAFSLNMIKLQGPVFLTSSKMGERSWAQRKIILRLNSILILSTLPESVPEASLKLPWTGTLNSRNSEVTTSVLCGPFHYNSNCKRFKSIVSALKPRISFIVCVSTWKRHMSLRPSVPQGWFLCWKP